MIDNRADSHPSTWDPALDAVIAAPKHHKVLFENERLRVLEVTLEPKDEEPVHHHRWPSVFVFDQVQRPVYDFAPGGTQLPPNRNVIQAIETWNYNQGWWPGSINCPSNRCSELFPPVPGCIRRRILICFSSGNTAASRCVLIADTFGNLTIFKRKLL